MFTRSEPLGSALTEREIAKGKSSGRWGFLGAVSEAARRRKGERESKYEVMCYQAGHSFTKTPTRLVGHAEVSGELLGAWHLGTV